jgi:hypothetical protein
MQVSGRMVIAIDGKTVRGAKDKAGKAPHLVAALAHGIGAVLGQVAVAAKSAPARPARRSAALGVPDVPHHQLEQGPGRLGVVHGKRPEDPGGEQQAAQLRLSGDSRRAERLSISAISPK